MRQLISVASVTIRLGGTIEDKVGDTLVPPLARMRPERHEGRRP